MKKNAITCLLLLFGSLTAIAAPQGKAVTAEFIDIETKVEGKLRDKYQSLIATSLDEKAFRVDVQVTLAEQKKPKSDEQRFNQIFPEFTLGLIEAESIIARQEEELARVKARSSVDNRLASFKLQQVSISVGLLEAFQPDYVSRFRNWLEIQVRNDFGDTGQVQLTSITSAPLTSSGNIAQNEPLLEKLSKVQNLLGMAFFALVSLLGIFLFAKVFRNHSKAIADKELPEAQAAPAPQIQAPREEPMSATPVAISTGGGAESLSDYRYAEELKGKIGDLASDVGQGLQTAILSWFKAGQRGHIKIACFIDSLMSQESSEFGPTFVRGFRPPPQYSDELSRAYREMPQLETGVRRRIMESVYWDLLTLKTVGPKALQQPFEFFGQLSPKNVQSVLAHQNPKVQAMAIMHLPQDTRTRYMSKLDMDSKTQLLSEALSIGVIQSEELDSVNQTLESQVVELATTQHGVSFDALTPRLLESLNPYEDVVLVRSVARQLSDGGHSIKTAYPTLAFVDEWPDDVLSMFLKRATSTEVLALIRTLPSEKERILNLAPPRVTEIVADDLTREDKMKDAEKAVHLGSLKAKFQALVQAGQIDLEDLFPVYDETEYVNAA